jgi:hypothetical protein
MSIHAIQLSGKFNVEFPLDIDKSYEFKMTGGVNRISKNSQENGEYEFVYHLKPEFGEVITDKGTVVKIKKKGSQSQKLRYDIMSRDLNYEATMSDILTYLPDILDHIKSLK